MILDCPDFDIEHGPTDCTALGHPLPRPPYEGSLAGCGYKFATLLCLVGIAFATYQMTLAVLTWLPARG
jgi:hypothetical protein